MKQNRKEVNNYDNTKIQINTRIKKLDYTVKARLNMLLEAYFHHGIQNQINKYID